MQAIATPSSLVLGNITKFATPPAEKTTYNTVRAKRYALQNLARDLLPGERVCTCGRVVLPGRPGAEVWYAPKQHKAHFKNLMTCGSVWTCPVCGSKITERRRVEMRQALISATGQGLTPVMVTLTFSHSREMKLTDTLEALTLAWRRFRSGDPWRRLEKRFQLVASVSSLEVTWSSANGWHAHKHILFFSAAQPDKDQLQGVFTDRWQAILTKLGYFASDQRGVDVQIGDQRAGQYIAKWGLESEMTKAPIKSAHLSGLTPFAILEKYGLATDPKQRALYAGLFTEYASAFKGRHQLQWSRGSRDRFGLVEEKTDQELATETEEPSDLVARFDRDQWRVILALDLRADILRIAGQGDPGQLWQFLDNFGIHRKEGISESAV